MKPAGTDPFPAAIEILRTRRRSVELSLENGRLQARVPLRMAKREVDRVLPELRRSLWVRLRRERVFDQQTLQTRAAHVRKTLLADLQLPPFQVGFSKRQRRRWGSCVWDGQQRRIWISERLRGHPIWLIDVLLLHELIHLLVPNHGPRFQELMQRSPDHERGRGYLEALETADQIGGRIRIESAPELGPLPMNEEAASILPLFAAAAARRPC